MASDYIPYKDAKFDAWQAVFIDQADGSLGANVQALVAELQAAQANWNTGYEAHVAARNLAKAATGTKEAYRVELVAQIRVAAQLAQSDPNVSDEQRAAAGLPIHKIGGAPAPVPTSRPMADVDTSQRLRHVIHFRDANAFSKAKPKGVAGAEIWVCVSEAQAALPTPEDLHFLSLDTRTPYTAHYEIADAGKTAHYMLRWVNTRSEPGPWSETASATIGG